MNDTPKAHGWIRSFAVWHYAHEVETYYEVARHACSGRLMQYESGQGPCADVDALRAHTWQANVCTDCLALAAYGLLPVEESA